MSNNQKMGNLPFVSIITGYYNRKENIEESVRSILDQTYQNFEYIIFDDCSTDGTFELLENFKDPRLRLIRHSENIGFTKGIIAAIAESTGEYIAIHGAGDISFKERISKQVQFFQQNPDTSIVGCLVEDISHKGKSIHTPEGTNNFTQGEVMYPKSLYYKIGGYNSIFKYGQFTNLKLELLKLGNGGFVNEILYRRIHFQNGVTRNPGKIVEQRILYSIGEELSRKESILYTNVPKIVIAVCSSNIELIRGTPQEKLFIYYLKRNNKVLLLIYQFYKLQIIGDRAFKFISNSTIIRKLS